MSARAWIAPACVALASLASTAARAEGDARAIASLPAAERVDARTRLGEERWRAGDRDAAAEAFEAAVRDVEGPRLARVLAMEDLVAVDIARARIDHAARVVSDFPDLAPAATNRVRSIVLYARLDRLAVAWLAAFALAGALAARGAARLVGSRSARRALLRPGVLVFALYLGVGVALVAALRGDDARPFLALGAGVAAIGVVVRAFALARPRASLVVRLARALAGVASVVAVAFLALRCFHWTL